MDMRRSFAPVPQRAELYTYATVSDCAFSDDEIVEQSAVQPEPLYAYIAEANDDETLDQHLD